MNIRPFSEGCGKLIKDVQLSQLSDTDIDALRDALSEYGVLFFRDQQLPPEEHLRFAKRFGALVKNKFFSHDTALPDIAEVRKDADQDTNLGGGWHTDHSYDEEPAMGSILVARELPTHGGDTCFADMSKVYESLSPGLQRTLESLEAVHCNAHIYGAEGYYQNTDLSRYIGGTEDVSRATHPVVVRHPQSGRKILYVNPGFTLNFVGWTRQESQALLGYLYSQVADSGFTCQFNWEPGSVAIWDNRSTWHYAMNDYAGEARLMHRITLAGGALEAA
ncbi:MAG: TauD/TfdA family dioxygenase [Halieaceae bacterium]|nr:TauD/TfdA family dioxygenase [Halieaceae bacterium]